MKREDQELLERAEEKENNEEKPENEIHKQDDFFEDDFDREFWVKVMWAAVCLKKFFFAWWFSIYLVKICLRDEEWSRSKEK